MSRHKSFAKIWLAYWLVKPMVPCRKFLGRAKITTPAPGLPATGPSPREGPLLARAPTWRIGQPPTPPASLRQTEPAGAPSGLGVRGVSAGEARSRALRSGSLCCRCLDCAPGLLRRARALPLPLPLPLSVLPLVLFAPLAAPRARSQARPTGFFLEATREAQYRVRPVCSAAPAMQMVPETESQFERVGGILAFTRLTGAAWSPR